MTGLELILLILLGGGGAGAYALTTKPGQGFARDAWEAAGGPAMLGRARTGSADATGKTLAWTGRTATRPVTGTAKASRWAWGRAGDRAEARLAARREAPPRPVLTYRGKTDQEGTPVSDTAGPTPGSREHFDQYAAGRGMDPGRDMSKAIQDDLGSLADMLPKGKSGTGAGSAPPAAPAGPIAHGGASLPKDAPRDEEQFSADLTKFQRRMATDAASIEDIAARVRTTASTIATYAESLTAETGMDPHVAATFAQIADDWNAEASALAARAAALGDLTAAPRRAWTTFAKRYAGTREDRDKGTRQLKVAGFFAQH